MKKLTLILLLTSIFVGFVGCKEEQKPFSFYQIGPNITPPADKNSDEAKVIELVINHMFSMGCVRTGAMGGPIIIESADEADNDRQAIKIYDALYKKLSEEDFKKILKEYSPGTLAFNYQMLKGQAQPGLVSGCNKTILIEY